MLCSWFLFDGCLSRQWPRTTSRASLMCTHSPWPSGRSSVVGSCHTASWRIVKCSQRWRRVDCDSELRSPCLQVYVRCSTHVGRRVHVTALPSLRSQSPSVTQRLQTAKLTHLLVSVVSDNIIRLWQIQFVDCCERKYWKCYNTIFFLISAGFKCVKKILIRLIEQYSVIMFVICLL